LIERIGRELGWRLINEGEYLKVFASEEGKIIVLDCKGMVSIDLRRLVRLLFAIIKGDIKFNRFAIYLVVPITSGDLYEDLAKDLGLGLIIRSFGRARLVKRGVFIEVPKISGSVNIDDSMVKRLEKVVSLLEQIRRSLADKEIHITISFKERSQA